MPIDYILLGNKLGRLTINDYAFPVGIDVRRSNKSHLRPVSASQFRRSQHLAAHVYQGFVSRHHRLLSEGEETDT